MKALPLNNRPFLSGRLLCLTVMTILLANPVLATVSVALACNGQCCCCADAGESAGVTIRSIAAALATCCRPTDAKTCHMSTANLPDAAPALIHTPDRQSTDPIQLFSGNGPTTADQLQFTSPGSRATSVLALSDPPLYLQTCRLIC